MVTSRHEELLSRVYSELHRLAAGRARRGGSLQATALVHEAWLRLAESPDFRPDDSKHFLAAAAQAMRWISVDRARRRRASRLGTLDGMRLPDPSDQPRDDALIALDEAVERLAATYPDEADVVVQRYFGGLSVEETADALGISPATVKRRWTFARAWLNRAMESDCAPEASES